MVAAEVPQPQQLKELRALRSLHEAWLPVSACAVNLQAVQVEAAEDWRPPSGRRLVLAPAYRGRVLHMLSFMSR